MELKATPNCGVAYLDGVQVGSAAQTKIELYELLQEAEEQAGDVSGNITSLHDDVGDEFLGGLILFTTAQASNARGEQPDGKALRMLIEDNNLGSVAILTPFRNPNTGRLVTLYAWTVNFDGLRKWYQAEYRARNVEAIKGKPSAPTAFVQEITKGKISSRKRVR